MTCYRQGAIRPSSSPWCNAVVLVRKKDGGLCFSIDFRKLNVRTKKDSYPLPHIQEMLESLEGVSHIPLVLNLSQAFGRWKWTRHPNSIPPLLWGYWASLSVNTCHSDCVTHPMTFQRLMQNCLGELNLTYCLIYLDDVITFSTDEDDHLWHMRVIFDRFRAEHLKLKPSKCSLFRDKIVFLAHCVTREGYH